jgi:hypothetical protein
MKKFGNTLGGTTKSFIGVTGAIVEAGVAIDAFVNHFASGMEKLYFQSSRAGTTANNLLSFGQAAAQVGLDADAMKQGVTGMVAAVEASGGGLKEVMKGQLDVSDDITDSTERYLQMNKKLVEMFNSGDGAARAEAIAIAGMFQESQEQLAMLATNGNLDKLLKKYHDLQKANADLSQDAAKLANDYENATRDMENSFGRLGRRITTTMEPLLIKLYRGFGGISDLIGKIHPIDGARSAMDKLFGLTAADHKRNHYDTDEEDAAGAGGYNFKSDSLGTRNNNPGNLRYAHQFGATEGANGFAVFDTMQHGIEAQREQLKLYGARGNDTLSGMISTYAPSSENNTQAYIDDVSKRTGFDPSQHLDLNDDAIVKKVADAMMMHEGTLLGTSGAGGPSTTNGDVTVTNNFSPNITVTSSDPKAAGQSVVTAIDTSYARLQRNQKSPLNNVQPQGGATGSF